MMVGVAFCGLRFSHDAIFYFAWNRHLIKSEAREFARRIAAPGRLYTLISTTSGPTDGVHLTPDCKRTDHYGRKIQ
jgi:hypothetical protein